MKGLQDSEVQNKQSDYPYGYAILLLVITITILDLIIYHADNLPFVQFFNFFPIFRMYESVVAEEAISTFCICTTIILSVIFLILEARGAKYFRSHIS